MHQRLEEERERAKRLYARQVEILEQADAALDALRLTPLLDTAHLVIVRPLCLKSAGQILLYFPSEDRATVMPVLTASGVEKWRRTQFLSHVDNLELNARAYVHTDFDHKLENGDELTVRFVRPVQGGEIVGGCKVREITGAASYLALACEMREEQT
jgi:hypothetical protein